MNSHDESGPTRESQNRFLRVCENIDTMSEFLCTEFKNNGFFDLYFRVFFARDFSARERLLSLLGAGRAQKMTFLRVQVRRRFTGLAYHVRTLAGRYLCNQIWGIA